MGHHHEHHGHGHSHDGDSIDFDTKATKLIDHWIQHNNDHGQNYLRWAGEFKDHGLTEAGDLLADAEALTRQITQILSKAAQLLPGSRD